jgi:hypothetical protein
MKNMSNMSNMSHSMTDPKEIIIMMIIMFISGLLSSMNIWVDKISDINFHLNDVYMALLMCGWSLILIGIYYINITLLIIGIIMTLIIIYCIRNQICINENQYLKGMIPHHSMAVLMSKKLLENIYNARDNSINIPTQIKKLAMHIINSQENEINLMKARVKYLDKIKT